MISFSEYCDSLDPYSLSWAVLLRRIKALDCVGSIHVFLYEDFRANNDVLFDTVRDVFKVPPLQRDQNVSRNTSLSEDGYKLIMATKGVDSESARRVREFVLREFGNSGARKPCVMTSLEKGLLKDKYVKDILVIS